MKKKRIIATMSAAVLALGITAASLALAVPVAAKLVTPSTGYGFCGGWYSIMWDKYGNFLDKDAFEANLDKLIEDGYILSDDRDYLLERYDWYSTYGGVADVRGGCGGRGMGWRMYR